MKSALLSMTCVLAGTAAAQSPLYEHTTTQPFENLGTLELVSGVITPPAPAGSLFATSGVIYNNTCLPYAGPAGCTPQGLVYISTLPVGNSFIDDGRIPAFNTPTPNAGILNKYRVTSFNIIYYTDEDDTSIGGPGARMTVLFYEDYNRCTNMTTAGTPTASFPLVLPGTLTPGTVRGVNINIGLAGGFEFDMQAEANGTYDANGGLDTFGYGFQVVTLTPGKIIQITRAGQVLAPNPCISGDGTYYKNPGITGTGLGNNDNFWQQQSATVGTCVNGTASVTPCPALTGPNYGGFYMSITADIDDCNGNHLPDFDDIASGLSLDVNGDEIPDECQGGPPVVNYCTAGTTANSCNAAISATGTPSVSAASGFIVNVANVEGQKQGIIFYGNTIAIANPWATGSSSFLCVKAPTQRTGVQNSGGTLNACNGAMTLDVFAYLSTHPTALGNPFSAGQKAFFQGWFRDPPSPKTTSLSDGLQVTFTP